jgi:biopolymer transport protein ExbB
MLTERDCWSFGIKGDNLVRRALGLLLFGCAALLVAWSVGSAHAIGDEQESEALSVSARSGRSRSITSEDDAENGSDRKPRPAGSESSDSVLSTIGNSSAPVAIVTTVISLMSFYLMALVVWMALYYRTPTAVPRELVREVEELLDQTKYNEAYQRLVADSSFLARVLASGVRRLPAGLSQAQRAMELANEDVTMEMEHRTTYLATVGTLGPMIGLVGTVYGMIIAFRVIALEASTPQASQLAAGISTALYSTLEGIAISIPAIFFYAMYRNRIARLSLEVGMAAEPLLDRFAPGVRLPTTIGNEPCSHDPSKPAHPHPFAVSAALKAAGSQRSGHALPPVDAVQP